MPNYNDDDLVWTVLLLICNEAQDEFIVVHSKERETFTKERLCLPNMDNEEFSFEPVDTAVWLAQTHLQLSLKSHELRLICSDHDDTGYLVYLFTNNTTTTEINMLFEDELSNGWYQTMPFKRAGLAHSGFDSIHREFLDQKAHLMETSISSSGEADLKIAYSDGDLGLKMRGYSSKPL
jgi:hypothetical protein